MSEREGMWTELSAVRKASDLIDLARKRYRHLKDVPWFRGHQDGSWKLCPSVMRSPQAITNEAHLLTSFMLEAPSRYPDCPPQLGGYTPTAPAMWLSLARQYGLRTRLLDWSKSILVAAFFAVEPNTATDGADGALWVLAPGVLNRLHGRFKGKYGIPTFGSEEVSRELAEGAIHGGSDPGALATAAPQTDVRIFTQQCHYTIHGNNAPLEEIAGSALDRAVIPSSAKREIYRELRLIGIHGSTLFPDLQHLTAELGEGPPIKAGP